VLLEAGLVTPSKRGGAHRLRRPRNSGDTILIRWFE
jgi:hypothetical protein